MRRFKEQKSALKRRPYSLHKCLKSLRNLTLCLGLVALPRRVRLGRRLRSFHRPISDAEAKLLHFVSEGRIEADKTGDGLDRVHDSCVVPAAEATADLGV